MLSFHFKFVQTDRQTDNGETILPPIPRYGGITRQKKNPYTRCHLQVEKVDIGCSCHNITLHHTIPTFNDPVKGAS